MKSFAKISLVAFLSLLAVSAFAADATYTWINPTTDTSGATIPATGPTALKETVFEWGACTATGGFTGKLGEQIVAAPGVTTTVTGLTLGQKYCARAFAVNVAGGKSVASNTVSKVIPIPVPNPPTLSATVDVVWAYTNGNKFVAVGSIPIGTPCNAAVSMQMFGETFYEVPASSVRLFKGVKQVRGNYVTMCEAS